MDKKKRLVGVFVSVCFLAVVAWSKWPNKKVECGFENCHGLEISCGFKVPKGCTEEYLMGDRCRRYADCQIIDGRCHLVKGDKFEKCKSCTENCLANFEGDVMAQARCESECE